MKTTVLNGILCKHDCPIESFEYNDGVLFLHNEERCLGELVKRASNYKKASISYFVSDRKQTEDEAMAGLLAQLYGSVDVDISSDGHPYSEVTPDICWTHDNEFKIGGHDMNRELGSYIGKWVLIRVSIA